MPVEKILRAYIDETVDEEIIEETIEKQVTELEKKKIEEELETVIKDNKKEGTIKKSEDTIVLEKPDLEKEKVVASALKTDSIINKIEKDTLGGPKENNIKLTIETPIEKIEPKEEVVNRLSFNDTDSVVNYDKKASPSNNPPPVKLDAPKTLERLEKISFVQNEKRKAEEADDEDDEDKITIFGDINLELDAIDVQNLDKNLKLEPDPILNDIEILG
jgi:hypothetical protein